MNTTKKRELMKEMVINQLSNAKLEPLEAIKLVEFVNNLSDKKVEKILSSSIKK